MQIHGYHQHPEMFDDLKIYGSDAPSIKELIREKREFSETLIPECDILKGEVIWSARSEMVRHVDDFLARRRRALILDCKQSLKMAEAVARLLSRELGKGRSWRRKEIEDYEELVQGYLC
jgi:glycerol-3-phosphate dehydrogenase